MPENKHLRFLLTLLYIILGLAAAYLILKYVVKWLLPFLIAFLVAAMLKKPTAWLCRKLPLPRGVISIGMVVFVYGVVGTLVGLLITFIVDQLRSFVADLPNYLSSIPEVLSKLWSDGIALVQRLPSFLRNPLLNFINSLGDNISVSSMNVGSVVGTVKDVAFSIPTIIIFTVAMFVSTFYLLKDFDGIMAFIAAQFPARICESASRLRVHMMTTFGRWLRAILIMILVTFTELTIAFLIYGLDYAVLIAALVAIVDALPVFGAGTVLIPWAILLFVTGNYSGGVFMALVYVVIVIIRNIIEPRILGDHIGLNPLVMLICFYLGYVTLGLVGMFILPVTLVCLDKLQEWGYIRVWREPEAAPADIAAKKPLRSRLFKKK